MLNNCALHGTALRLVRASSKRNKALDYRNPCSMSRVRRDSPGSSHNFKRQIKFRTWSVFRWIFGDGQIWSWLQPSAINLLATGFHRIQSQHPFFIWRQPTQLDSFWRIGLYHLATAKWTMQFVTGFTVGSSQPYKWIYDGFPSGWLH